MLIDIHCHILPETDDGALNEESSISMLQAASQNGVSKIIATPHYIDGSIEWTTKSFIEEKVGGLNQTAVKGNINIEILPGCEIFISPGVPQLLARGVISSLNHSRYVLLELPMGEVPGYVSQVLYELQLLKYIPILAHPERSHAVMENPGLLMEFIEKGVLLQVNAGSITGLFGKRSAKMAWTMLNGKMAAMVATDAHNASRRAPVMQNAYWLVKDKLSEEEADRLFKLNPLYVVQNEEIPYIESAYQPGWSMTLANFLSGLRNILS